MNIEIIGYLAALLTTSSFLPQVIKVWKTKSVSGVSFTMYFVMLTGVVFWGIYGVFIHSNSIIIANSITALLQVTILYFIWKSKKAERR